MFVENAMSNVHVIARNKIYDAPIWRLIMVDLSEVHCSIIFFAINYLTKNIPTHWSIKIFNFELKRFCTSLRYQKLEHQNWQEIQWKMWSN